MQKMKATRAGADARFQPQIANRQVSADGAREYVLRLHDGSLVETVAMHTVIKTLRID